MRVHHLNCISTCPLGGSLMDPRTGGWSLRARLVNHSLLIETDAGLVLVDTGLGLRDVADPRGRLSRFFLLLVSPEFREEVMLFCSHDVREFERLAGQPFHVPAGAVAAAAPRGTGRLQLVR